MRTGRGHPYLVLGKKLDLSDGYAFLTQPFPRAEEVSDDADAPVQVDWLTTSYIRLRLHDPDATPSH